MLQSHFSASQWTSEGASRKLKDDAIPDVFVTRPLKSTYTCPDSHKKKKKEVEDLRRNIIIDMKSKKVQEVPTLSHLCYTNVMSNFSFQEKRNNSDYRLFKKFRCYKDRKSYVYKLRDFEKFVCNNAASSITSHSNSNDKQTDINDISKDNCNCKNCEYYCPKCVSAAAPNKTNLVSHISFENLKQKLHYSLKLIKRNSNLGNTLTVCKICLLNLTQCVCQSTSQSMSKCITCNLTIDNCSCHGGVNDISDNAENCATKNCKIKNVAIPNSVIINNDEMKCNAMIVNNENVITFCKNEVNNIVDHSSSSNKISSSETRCIKRKLDNVSHENISNKIIVKNSLPLGNNYTVVSHDTCILIDNKCSNTNCNVPNNDVNAPGTQNVNIKLNTHLSNNMNFIDQKCSSQMSNTNKKQKLSHTPLHYEKINNHNDGDETINLEIENLKLELSILKEECNNQKTMLNKLFSIDQQRALTRNSNKGSDWSNETIKKSLQIKFSCGSTGYNSLKDMGYPLPSIRTLARKIEHIKINPGVLTEVFDIMVDKVSMMDELDKDCNIVLDEASLSLSNCLDPSTKGFIGHITIPENKTGRAKKALVFLLSGIRSRWKQIVCYHFTDSELDGSLLKVVTLDIIERSEKIGLKVHNIISDMAPSNMKMYKEFGFLVGEKVKTIYQIDHPCDQRRKLCALPDPVHIYKNIRSGIENNKVLTLSKFIVEKYHLPSNEIRMDHFEYLISVQIENELKLAPNFEPTSLHPNNLLKMKVTTTYRMVNHNVGAALDYLSEAEKYPELATTGWFAKCVFKWFKLVSNRTLQLAFSLKNPAKFNEALNFLSDFIEIVQNIEVGVKGIWKPFQSGIKLCTETIIYLAKYFVTERKYDFFLTGHCTQCCLENVFSTVRVKHPTPTCLQFKQDVRLLIISQYMKSIKNTSYDDAKCHSLLDFLDFNKCKKITPELIIPNISINWSHIKLSCNDENSLYCVAGFIVYSVKSYQTTCEDCFKAIISTTVVHEYYTSLIKRKEYKENCLTYVTPYAYQFFVILEKIYLSSKPHLSANVNTIEFLISQAKKCTQLDKFAFVLCHDIKNRLLKRFFLFRLRVSSKQGTLALKNHYHKQPYQTGSKTMVMHNITNRK